MNRSNQFARLFAAASVLVKQDGLRIEGDAKEAWTHPYREPTAAERLAREAEWDAWMAADPMMQPRRVLIPH